MAANTLLLTVLSGLVLLAIVVAILRIRGWRRDPAATPRPRSSSLSSMLGSPAAWTVAFLVLVLLAVTGALAVVGGLPITEAAQTSAIGAMLALSGLLFLVFVFAGVYSSVRSRGYGSAPAVGLSSVAVGLLALVVVVAHLFLS